MLTAAGLRSPIAVQCHSATQLMMQYFAHCQLQLHAHALTRTVTVNAGLAAWNSMPENIRAEPDIGVFWKLPKTHLFNLD